MHYLSKLLVLYHYAFHWAFQVSFLQQGISALAQHILHSPLPPFLLIFYLFSLSSSLSLSLLPLLSMCRQGSMLYVCVCVCVCACAGWMGMLHAGAESCKVTEGMERDTEPWRQWRCSALFLSTFSSSHPSISVSSLSLFLFIDWGGPPALVAAPLSQLQQHHQVRACTA